MCCVLKVHLYVLFLRVQVQRRAMCHVLSSSSCCQIVPDSLVLQSEDEAPERPWMLADREAICMVLFIFTEHPQFWS